MIECCMADNNKINTRVAVISWFMTVGYMGLIFYLSSRSGFHLPRLPDNFDKLVHMCIYIPLAFLFYRSLRKSGMKRYVFITAVFLATLYGVSDEVHQLYVAGRDASLGDTVADLTGAFLGGAGARFIKV